MTPGAGLRHPAPGEGERHPRALHRPHRHPSPLLRIELPDPTDHPGGPGLRARCDAGGGGGVQDGAPPLRLRCVGRWRRRRGRRRSGWGWGRGSPGTSPATATASTSRTPTPTPARATARPLRRTKEEALRPLIGGPPTAGGTTVVCGVIPKASPLRIPTDALPTPPLPPPPPPQGCPPPWSARRGSGVPGALLTTRGANFSAG